MMNPLESLVGFPSYITAPDTSALPVLGSGVLDLDDKDITGSLCEIFTALSVRENRVLIT